jgi:ATP-dependent helicase/nuclease subunit A
MRVSRRLHVSDDLPVRAMNQLSFDESGSSQTSLLKVAVPQRSLDGAEPSARTLTGEQEQAVARRGEPLLLAAGAGSGKTSVLVERFVRAVREDGIAPGRILAITFTERAAGELRERVRGRFAELGEREAARDTEAAFVSTFHGFCARLLRVHPLAAGLDPEFVILDEGLAARLRGQAWAGALKGFLQGERSEAVDLMAAWGADRVRAMVGGTYAELRSKGERLPRLPVPVVFQPTLPVPLLQPMHPEPVASNPEPEPSEEAFGEMHAEQISARPAPEGRATAEELGEIDADGKAAAVKAAEVDAEGARACALLGELLERFGREYELLKERRGAVDFDDLELGACALLDQHENVRKAWAERFELMMVDEFQDTNPRQLAILRALERGNLFTVGDELQSIYGFRHADVALFRARRDELAERGASLSLTRNFRGRKPLLDVVNVVFAERFGDGFTPLAAGRPDTPAPADEPIVELLLTGTRGWDEDDDLAARIAGELAPAPRWRQAEARLLAQRVAELVQSGAAKPGDVAVLLRAVGDLEVYERALQDRGLSTLATVGGFWGGQQVGDLLAYLRALANPLDELALYGTLASPLVGVSSDALALLGRAAKASKRGVFETLDRVAESLPDDLPADSLPTGPPPADDRPGDPLLAARRSLDRLAPADRDLLVRFRARLLAERAAAGRRTISQLIERALDQSGYVEHVLSLGWAERRLANVHKLLRVARRYEASEGRDLRGFLDHVAHQQDGLSGAEPDAPVADGEFDAVRLMSIHAAKGLEFGVVCVADLGRAQNLGVPDLLVDGDRVGLRLARLDGSQATPSLAWVQLCEERRRAQAEEEDRILYVAMTRARERLLLSGAVDLERWPEQRLGAAPISWLGPALSSELPASVQLLHPPLRELTVGASDGTRVRVGLRLNVPDTLGTVLRLDDPSSAGGGNPSPFPTRAHTIATGEQQRQASSPREIVPDDSGPPATLSYTALTELERCGYRYYLERVLGLPEQRVPTRTEDESGEGGLEARLRGTIVHRLLESIDFARAVVSPEDVSRVAHELGARVSPREREQLSALLGKALDTDLAARLAAASRGAHREYPFAFSLGLDRAEVSGRPKTSDGPEAFDDPGEPLITGVIDILAREPDGGLLVVDYKSDRVGPDEDLWAVVERDYSIQRLLYALAVLNDGAPRVEIVHWFLHRPSEPIGAVYTAADKPELEDRMAVLVQNVRAHSFIVSQDPHRGLCLTCPGRSGLCSWNDSDTLRERVGA